MSPAEQPKQSQAGSRPRAARDIKHRGVYEHPRGSGIWWTQYFTSGRRHRERAGSKSNAVKLYRKRKTEALTQAKLPELTRRHVTFGELLDDAIAFAVIHHKHPAGIRNMAARARPRLGPLWAASITHADLSRWIEARKISNATFNRYKSFFSLCYREGIRAGKVESNPAQLIRRRREPSGRKRYLTPAEYSAVCAAIQANADLHTAAEHKQLAARWNRRLAAFITSIWTGMRRGEQATLEIPQVNFSRGEIQLSNTKNGDSREIPIVSEVRSVLLELIGRRTSGLVFERERAGTAPGTIELAWFERLLADLKTTDYTWHNNRHTFCSWLAIGGTPLKTIQELAGHRSIATTAKYAHLSPSHKRAELEAVAAAHRNPKVQPIAATSRAARSKSATATKTAIVPTRRRAG